jgi:AraC-like DNA-binding protein/mannose-6-phosphate isomerase-like protein (cupin superfamily)
MSHVFSFFEYLNVFFGAILSMDQKFRFIPSLVKKIFYVTHKGKQKGFFRSTHVHPEFHEMFYVDYGSMIVTLEDRDIHVRPGECLFIRGGICHSLQGEKESPFDFLNIMFVGDLPTSILEKPFKVNRQNLDLLEKLKKESVECSPHFKDVLACVLTELIVRFIRQAEYAVPEKTPESVDLHRYQSKIVNRALKVIVERYAEPLTLKDVSRASGIGDSRLAKLLKSETGESFCAALHQQRIAAAKHMIREDACSIGEISAAVGYKSTSFFFKIFKRVSGMTPMEYARSLCEPEEVE